MAVCVDGVLVGSAEVVAGAAVLSAAAGNFGDDLNKLMSLRGVGGKGWRNDKAWKNNVNTVRNGGTMNNLNGQVPTQQEAIDLIKESGGTVNRIEGPHESPKPHSYNHINYTTATGKKGRIKIQ